MAATRWGIAGPGLISSDFAGAIRSLPKEDHVISAVASRSIDKAQVFAQRFDIPTVYGSYDELAKDPNVEVVYIGTIHPTHKALCVLMLNAGKHVVVEKQMCMTAADTREVFALAKQNQLFIVEGHWSRYFPLYKKLREQIAEGAIGDVKLVEAKLGFRILDKARVTERALGGGALRDTGCYPLMFATMLLGNNPEKVIAAGTLLPNGLEESVAINLVYSGGRMAHLLCHSAADLNLTATVYGSEGNITLPLFWSPEVLNTPKEKFECPIPKSAYHMNHKNSEGLVYEVQGVRESLLKGELENPLMTHADSIAISEIIDEALKQIGAS